MPAVSIGAYAQEREEPDDDGSEAEGGWLERRLRSMRERSSSEPEYPEVMDLGVVVGGLQSGAGLTLGVRLTPYRHEHFLTSIEARGSHRRYWGLNGVLGYEYERMVTYLYSRYRHMPEEDYYGLESLPSPPVRTNYRHDEVVGGALAGFSPAAQTMAGLHASYIGNWIGEGLDEDYPSVEEEYSAAEAPGLGGDDQFFVWGVWFEYDSRDLPYEREYGRRFAPTQYRLGLFSLVASRGFYFSAEQRRYMHIDGSDLGFNEFEFESEQFLPLQRDRHVIALRQYLVLTSSEEDNDVPFYMMPTLGGSRTVRGYSSNRLRDRHALLFNAEYHWRVLPFIQLAPFVDAGYVFAEMDDLDLSDPAVGYGAGVRVITGLNVPLRVDFARSREDFRIYVRFHSPF